MLRLVGLLRRAEGWSREDFASYWVRNHAEVARHLPGVRGYVISLFDSGETGEEPRFDGMAELWFDDRAAYDAARKSPQWQASVSDHPFVSERVILTGEESHRIV